MTTTTTGRTRYTDSGAKEFRWTCTCGNRSVWFPTAERRDAAQAKHVKSHEQGR